MSDPDDLLKKLEELQKQNKETRINYVDEYRTHLGSIG